MTAQLHANPQNLDTTNVGEIADYPNERGIFAFRQGVAFTHVTFWGHKII